MSSTTTLDQDIRRRRTVRWVISLATVGMVFDGYDLVIYGAVLSTFLGDSSHIGEVTPTLAGTLGSYALLGMMAGALMAGAVGDRIGRRKVMLIAYAWFSVGMFVTALMTTTTSFGVLRFLTGLGIGALIGTTATLVTEIAPPGRKNLASAISYAGVPLGSLLGALLTMLFLEAIGWRALFMVGALPLVTLLPLAILKMPESVQWLVARGELEKAREVSERTGIPMPAPRAEAEDAPRVGFAGLFSPGFVLATVVVGLMSALGQFLNYYLNTWLPVLMEQVGFNTRGSLSFLLVLAGGAIVGALTGARFADRFGARPVVATCFVIGAAFIALMSLDLPLGVRLACVAVVGFGTTGTSILIYGLVATQFPTPMRGAAVAWAAGFGRLGGVSGPLLGGLFLAAGVGVSSVFYVLAGLALVGAVLSVLVPRAHSASDTPVGTSAPEPSPRRALAGAPSDR
ncbi:benzoate transporter [Nocardioides flavus (ex Wang et al. 2016)]|uniref:Benzoate transporter n=1 Tax=Nocardioides flavus (ex Wang et al. 2016) TaxID=2058780 RepID=A0ABQ3HM73_9ACTN|nr:MULTISPECIES: aromatic acid/H+ symport family MFS transporter [Nocardioides]GHE18018.1 benzoate transporter [Nocardioides flavus (ex Wang et al. 2016)]